MNAERTHPEDEDVVRVYILNVVRDHGRTMLLTAIAVATVVAMLAGVYLLWGQPSVRTATLEFRPTFSSAVDGEYPNELPFSPSDITAASVVDAVYDANNLQEYCSREDVRSSLFVTQYSAAYAALEAEFQSRLQDPSLSGIQRAELQSQYETRRSTLPLGYRLVFLVPDACNAMPPLVVDKVLNDVLSTWATESEQRRGVLNLSVQVLTPNVLEIGVGDSASLLIRADLVRSSLRRLLDNVRRVEEIPGAALVRVGETRVSFAEVRAKFEDLIQSRLEPLVVAAGRGLGVESIGWVDQALTTARLEERAAEGRAEAYLEGLREYSGAAPGGSTTRPGPQPSTGETQGPMPQIDGSFIDRMISLSKENIAFRQDMTRSMVTASVEAVETRAKLSYYENLSLSLRRPSSQSLPAAEVESRLASIVADGKALTTQFNELYAELSRVSLRPQAGLYQINQPVQSGIYRAFTRNSLLLVVAGAFAMSLLMALAFFIIRKRLMGPSQVVEG